MDEQDKPKQALVPKGVAHVELGNSTTVQHIAIVLVPQFSMSAFSAALEPFRIANQLTGQPLYHWRLLSEDGKPVRASNGVEVCVDGNLSDTERDTLVFVCSGVEPQKMTTDAVAHWVRRQWRNGRIVVGLCTGAHALAQAGILSGKQFTLHWENLPAFREMYPDLEPLEQLYTVDGRIMTCSGGSAATDLCVKLIKDSHGQLLSQEVLNMCLVPFQRAGTDRQTASQSAAIGTRNQKLVEMVVYFEEHLEEGVNLEAASAQVGVSRRQMERLFKQYTGTSPREYLMNMQLQRGRALLAETNLSVAEVAIASGFLSAVSFSKRYRSKYGQSPFQFRP